ncbi:MAG: hypothetical protein WB767_16805 [Nocardioides sp.]
MEGRRRLAVVLAIVVGVGTVVIALIAWSGGSDEVGSTAASDRDIAVCLGAVLAQDDDCSGLRRELADQPPGSIDVVLLVPDQEGADRTSAVMLDSLQMWQAGLAGIDADLTIRPVSDRMGDGPSAHPLLDPEVVLIAASVGTHEGSGAGRALDMYDSQGERCGVFSDAFSLTRWSVLPTFRSHHSLPEGIVRQSCPDGGEVCVAINATLDPDSGVSPFEAFTLLGDEAGHCLRQAASGLS